MRSELADFFARLPELENVRNGVAAWTASAELPLSLIDPWLGAMP